jgi:ACT domain-containing protein
MKAIVTVIGEDRVGIIAGVSRVLAENRANILDISQTVMQEYFTMMMLVDLSAIEIPFADLSRLGGRRPTPGAFGENPARRHFQSDASRVVRTSVLPGLPRTLEGKE